MATKNEHIVSIKTFKYRSSKAPINGMTCSLEENQKLDLNSDNFWYSVRDVKCTLTEPDEAKYPGYSLYSSPLTFEQESLKADFMGLMNGVVPSSAIMAIEIDGLLQKAYSLRYKTVKIHEGFQERKEINGNFFLKIDNNKLSEVTPPNLDLLPNVVWKQIGKKGDQSVILFKLSKVNNVDSIEIPSQLYSTNSDDFTGDYYCYVISKIVYLIKN